VLDPVDRRILVASQDGLPLRVEPFAELARALGLPHTEVLVRLRRLRAAGVIRRSPPCRTITGSASSPTP
jgi:DNA-binding Lrp family transcriptional regulator